MRSSFVCVLCGLWRNVEIVMAFGSGVFVLRRLDRASSDFFNREPVNLDLFGLI